MTYIGAMTMPATSLVLPQNAVVLPEQEMRYIEGGKWTTYKGKDARNYLSVIASQAFGAAVTATKIGKFIAAASFTGPGAAVVALASAIGLALSVSYSCINAVMFGKGLYYYKKYGKFKANTTSFWKYTATLGIKQA